MIVAAAEFYNYITPSGLCLEFTIAGVLHYYVLTAEGTKMM